MIQYKVGNEWLQHSTYGIITYVCCLHNNKCYANNVTYKITTELYHEQNYN